MPFAKNHPLQHRKHNRIMTTTNPMTLLRKLLPIIVLLFITTAEANAQYTLVSFTGSVNIKQGARTVKAEKGMPLGAFDLIVIGEGSSATVFDKASSSEYTYGKACQISPNALVMEAKKLANSNIGNVHRNVGIGKAGTAEEGKMYVEKGKITLALEEYDPAGDEYMIDAKVLASFIVNSLNSIAPDRLGDRMPVTVLSAAQDGALHFQLENTTTEPLYINVIALRDNGSEPRSIRISELGQPVGCYVILPEQGIMRNQTRGIRPGERHILVATHYYFSIDELLENINKELAETGNTHKPVLDLPIYLKAL